MTVVSPASPPDVIAELRRRGVADVGGSTLARAIYSSDASLYRVVPQVVVRPRHRDELVATLEVARTTGTPLTMRGAGTSIAGNAVGTGIVVDTVRHLGRVLTIDAAAHTATVEPGAVHAVLQRAAARHGLRFGPDPSTHSRCTVGGMVGNNACGSRALGYGRTSDNVAALDVVFGTGEEARLGPGARGTDGDAGSVSPALTGLVDHHLGQVRTAFGRFSRQVSGYAMEQLLPENGRRVDRFLAGSEGTLAAVLQATVSLVPDEPRRLGVLGYPSMADAADAVPALLAVAGRGSVGARLTACEGLDSRIVDLMRARGAAVPQLPRGSGWLFVEVAGAEPDALLGRLLDEAGATAARTIGDPREAAALWRIREDGAGLAARSLGWPAYSGWEDAAVPPQHLGAWLRDFDELLREHGLRGVPYGHFGEGCVHVRIDFDFADGGRRFRQFLVAGARRLREYGGSLSGEHGDGRARSELLPLMYDEESLRLFAAAKAVCDPDDVLNPGVLVAPRPVDADLRPVRPRTEPATALRLTHDDGSLGAAVHRCTGVGRCVAPSPAGVMCPSYVATREEKDSTRGRARVLQEALDGELVRGLADPAVHEALDLCLACKGCASDCPTGVDMASYKAETLHQTWHGRRRPRSHYTLGRLPTWVRRSEPLAPLAARALRTRATARLAKAVAGVDPRRTLPELAARTLRRSAPTARLGDATPDVWVWADTFTDHFAPHTGRAAVRLLESAGLQVRLVDETACCALTEITTGQLDRARTTLAATVATLAPYAASAPVIGLEPSCLATLRSDAVELVGGADAETLAGGVLTLAELVTRLDLPVPDLTGVDVVAQPHCHHHAVIGWDTDERLLRDAGASVTRVPGCCGLAGSFGMEQGHCEVSVAVAESHLLPAVRAAATDAVVLADGMSCRLQLADLAGVQAVHLAELLARRT